MKKHVSTLLISIFLTACAEETSNQAANANTPSNPAPASAAAENHTANPDWPTYRVASEMNYQPFSFNNEKSQPVGFEIDLLREIARAESFNVHFVNKPRSKVAETLENGEFDIWSSSLSITPERQEKMDFSQPYLNFVHQAYVLNTPENSAIQTLEDLKGKKLAVNKNSQNALNTAAELTGSPDNVLGADNFYGSVKAVYAGNAVGLLGDNRVVEYYITQYPEFPLRAIDLGEKRKNLGFAIQKGNTKMQTKLNNGLEKIKADGTYNRLIEKWFGKQTP